MLDHLWHDVRLAFRSLRRARAFTAAAVLTLALGIAGTSVMFALVNGILLRPLPVREPDRLIVAWKELRSTGFAHYPFEASDIDVLGRETRLLESVAGVDYNGAQPAVTVEDGSASYVATASVTGRFFEVLGVQPLLGRALAARDDLTGAENALVITHRLWQRRYGGSPDVVGRRVLLRERFFTIVGVMPPDVEYPRDVEAWMTVAAQTAMVKDPRFAPAVDAIARMRPGTTLEQATSELGALTARLEALAPADTARGLTAVVRSYTDAVVGDVRAGMLVLFGAVGLVLLVASANVANLLLMRGETRRTEIAVRTAMGAGRFRLLRQLVAESVLLGIAACGAGLVVATWSLDAVIALAPEGLPRAQSVHIDAAVVAFTTVVALLVAAVAGTVPALSSARLDVSAHLRGGSRGAARRAATTGRRGLVVAQVALAVMVLAGAGLLARSFLRLRSADMGMAVDRLVFVELALPQSRYSDSARQLQFGDEVVAQLEAAPGILSATPVNVPPFSGTGGWDAPRFVAEGQSRDQMAANASLNLEAVHPNYFTAFQVTLVRGRAFTRADDERAPRVAIVSEDVAARTWPGQDPIGRRLKLGGLDSDEPWRTVVGVAAPTRYRELTRPRATLYVPAPQFVVTTRFVVLRTVSPLAEVADLARDRMRAVDPAVRVMRVAAFAELLERPLARPRFNAVLTGVFGAAALLLALVGVYSVISAHARQRHREVGVRLALGATRADVRRLILGDGLRLAGIGVAAGLLLAAASSRVLSALLYDVHPLDLPALTSAALLLLAAAGLASYLPARRAARVDPATMLRAE